MEKNQSWRIESFRGEECGFKWVAEEGLFEESAIWVNLKEMGEWAVWIWGNRIRGRVNNKSKDPAGRAHLVCSRKWRCRWGWKHVRAGETLGRRKSWGPVGHCKNSGFYREWGGKSQRKSHDLLFPQDPFGFCVLPWMKGSGHGWRMLVQEVKKSSGVRWRHNRMRWL